MGASKCNNAATATCHALGLELIIRNCLGHLTRSIESSSNFETLAVRKNAKDIVYVVNLNFRALSYANVMRITPNHRVLGQILCLKMIIYLITVVLYLSVDTRHKILYLYMVDVKTINCL